MVRIVLSFLALLPMLRPPGVCVCQAALWGEAFRAPRSAVVGHAHHGCCDGHCDGDDAEESARAPAQACRQSQGPVDNHRDHTPLCPAAKVKATWTAKPERSVTLAAFDVRDCVSAAPPGSPVAGPLPPSRPDRLSRPFFITFCS